MEYVQLDVTSEAPMPLFSEEMQHLIYGMTMQGGLVFFARDEEAEEVKGVLGVFQSHIPGVVEVGMMYTFGDNVDGVITRDFIDFIMKATDAKVMRCQLSDDPSREMVAELGFTHESTIQGIDLGEPVEQATEGVISIAGKGFDYLNIEQRNQLRQLIRLGAEEESSYTPNLHIPSDNDIDTIFADIAESKYDVYVRLEDGAVIALLMIDPTNPQSAVIGSVVVHPDHRLKGIGRLLVAQAVSDYGDAERLVLAVTLQSTPHLREFFGNCGLIPVATVHKFASAEAQEVA
ncbi:hypothetical protein pEaSNUABM38_00102 [Erwinia phage pEa_SNUABM_38]|nr:hypothetical protein pEaSNUABM38_00102 [Erwinia phage pEa_SNUABM_38]